MTFRLSWANLRTTGISRLRLTLSRVEERANDQAADGRTHADRHRARTRCLCSAPFLAGSANGGEPSADSAVAPRGIVVVGDSITARYNDKPGDAMQGWWSIVGRHYDAKVTTYAQSGSGYLRPGQLCTGNRFIDRQQAFTGEAPSLFIIEGGRNDWADVRRRSVRHGDERRDRARGRHLPHDPADVPAPLDPHHRDGSTVGADRPSNGRSARHRASSRRRRQRTASSSSRRPVR